MPVPVPVPAVAALPLAQGIPSRSPASASVLPPRPVLSTASRSTQLAQAQSPQSAQPLQAPQSLQLQSAPLSSAAPTSLPPSAQMTPTQAGEPAQVEVMQALTPVVESSELPAQPVSLAPAMQAHSANDAYASQAGQNTASASAPAMAAQGLAHGSSGASNAGGIYLQFGAFSQATNADAARERLARNWNNAMPLPQVVMNGNLYRVYSGPFSSRQEADAAARQLEGAGAGKSVIVLR
ncbi:MAG: SPOR domain-containing protein [Janthinobacterium lividum]